MELHDVTILVNGEHVGETAVQSEVAKDEEVKSKQPASVGKKEKGTTVDELKQEIQMVKFVYR